MQENNNQQHELAEVQNILAELGLEIIGEAEILEALPEAAGVASRPDRDVGH